MSRRLVHSAIAAGCVVAAVGVGALGARSASSTAVDGAALASIVDARVEQAAAGLHARLGTLAELPRLAAAVSTDVTTVRGLTQEELAFRPRAGETIAIGQLPKLVAGKKATASAGPAATATGGVAATASAGAQRWAAPVVLLLLPDGAEVPAMMPAGPELRIAKGGLTISEALAVTPLEPSAAAELDGVVAASWAIDVRDLVAALEAAHAGASLVIGARQLSVGAPSSSFAGSPPIDVPLQSKLAAGAHLLLHAPPTPRPIGYWAGAAFLVVVAGVLIALRGKRETTAEVLFAPATTPAVWAVGSDPGAATPSAEARPPRTPVAQAAANAPAIRTLGRYEVVRLLGSGGMAEVYLARLTGEAGFTKLIALKILQPALARQTMVVELFLDEARLASQLDHPNIVEIIDLGRADDEYYIAMEFVDGADLAGLIEMNHRQQRAIPLSVAVSILRKICDGLHAAHTGRAADGTPLSLVHRDVKSANVFVAKNGVVKIGDFGIAKASDESRVSRTEIGLVKGTPGYMAPEHRLGQPLDGRADLYGVGAIAYELLAGVPVNLDLVVLATKGTEGWPHLAPLSTYRNDVPPELEQVVLKALAYERTDRFADCAALETALETIANRYPAINSEKTVAQWIDVTLRAAAAAGVAAAGTGPTSPSAAALSGNGGRGVG